MATLDKFLEDIGKTPIIRKTGNYQEYQPEGIHKDVIYFAVDTGYIYFNGQEFGKDDTSKLEQSIKEIYSGLYESDLGNAVLVNKTTLKKVSIPIEELKNYPADEWEPIGVVVIPTNHDVYGTGECGVMALKAASIITPDEGSTITSSMYWGGVPEDEDTVPELELYDRIPTLGSRNNIGSDIIGVTSNGNLPGDDSVGSNILECPHDPEAYYIYGNSAYIPSPYLEGGLRNPLYYQTAPLSTETNAMSDFKGKQNTDILCSKATAQADWKTSIILNEGGPGYYPAACACWRYHTVGTTQGDWFLPACGELGYVYSRILKINEIIESLQTYFGTTLFKVSGFRHWTSSKYSKNNTRVIQTGSVNSTYRNANSTTARPFIRLKFSKSSRFLTTESLDEIKADIKELQEAVFYKYRSIDLGLPSGLLWCDRNVGATSPEGTGLFFAWGETEGYTKEQAESRERVFGWSNYKWGGYNSLEKYCNRSSEGKDGFIDNLTTLLPEDDAATLNMGSDWRMPTAEEVGELIKNTDAELLLSDGTIVKVENNGQDVFNWPTNNSAEDHVYVLGTKFISRKDSSKSIFFPATGNFSSSTNGQGITTINNSGKGFNSSCSNSSIQGLTCNSAGVLMSSGKMVSAILNYPRCEGCQVRGVTTKDYSKGLNFYTKEESDEKFVTKDEMGSSDEIPTFTLPLTLEDILNNNKDISIDILKGSGDPWEPYAEYLCNNPSGVHRLIIPTEIYQPLPDGILVTDGIINITVGVDTAGLVPELLVEEPFNLDAIKSLKIRVLDHMDSSFNPVWKVVINRLAMLEAFRANKSLNSSRLDGLTLNNLQTGGWLNYPVTNSPNKSFKIAQVNDNCSLIYRIRAYGDINYPSYGEWVLRINYPGGDWATSVTLVPSGLNTKSLELKVFIDSSKGIWINFNGKNTNSLQLRTEKGDYPGTYNSPYLEVVNGTPDNVVKTIVNSGSVRNGDDWGSLILQGNAESADKLGSEDVGSSIVPIYLEKGTPKPISNPALHISGTVSGDDSVKYIKLGEVTGINSIHLIGDVRCVSNYDLSFDVIIHGGATPFSGYIKQISAGGGDLGFDIGVDNGGIIYLVVNNEGGNIHQYNFLVYASQTDLIQHTGIPETPSSTNLTLISESPYIVRCSPTGDILTYKVLEIDVNTSNNPLIIGYSPVPLQAYVEGDVIAHPSFQTVITLDNLTYETIVNRGQFYLNLNNGNFQTQFRMVKAKGYGIYISSGYQPKPEGLDIWGSLQAYVNIMKNSEGNYILRIWLINYSDTLRLKPDVFKLTQYSPSELSSRSGVSSFSSYTTFSEFLNTLDSYGRARVVSYKGYLDFSNSDCQISYDQFSNFLGGYLKRIYIDADADNSSDCPVGPIGPLALNGLILDLDPDDFMGFDDSFRDFVYFTGNRTVSSGSGDRIAIFHIDLKLKLNKTSRRIEYTINYTLVSDTSYQYITYTNYNA